jgi:hypothetical protein
MTEYDYGYQYAKHMDGTPGFGSSVNIEKMIHGTESLPVEDELSMLDAGVKNIDVREYWRGFNAYHQTKGGI